MAKRNKRLVKMFNAQAGRCAYCLKDMVLDLGFPETATIDHIRPTSKGGDDGDHNVLCCCSRCNSSKGNKNLVKWLIKRTYDEKYTQGQAGLFDECEPAQGY